MNRRERLLAGIVSGPLGRLASFVVELGAALGRAVSGRRGHPEQGRRWDERR